MKTLGRIALAVTTALCLVSAGPAAEDDMEPLEVGDEAPQFTLTDDQGETWNSEDHYGEKIVVVYFYPADMTPGCTRQACGFRDDASRLTEEDVVVVGVSGDSVRNHQLFKQAHDLNFTLLSDPQGEVAAKFGVPYELGEWSIEREIDGAAHTLTRTATISRWTFVIDKDGRVALVRDLKAERAEAGEDAQTVLEFVRTLD